jgi:hypothetical protein
MQSMIEDNKNGQNSKNNIVKYSLKVLSFILFLILSPIIYIAILWLGFKMLVLNGSIDIKPLINFAAKKLKPYNNDETDINELNEYDLVMVDVEDITNKKF